MKISQIRNYQIFSIIFTFILGILLHFTYALSGQNPIIATFSAVNESVWEHLKLIFFPTLITILIGCILFKDILPQYLSAKASGLFAAMLFLIVFYFTYVGILGESIPFIDILSFFVAIFLEEFITCQELTTNKPSSWQTSLFLLILLLICFIVFTFSPPQIGLFQDPITGSYGISSSK